MPDLRERPLTALSVKARTMSDTDVLVLVGNLFLVLLSLWVIRIFMRVLPYGMFDFNIFRNAGAAVLHGKSPWSVDGFIYPATAAVAFVPFGALSFVWGGWIFVALIIAATLGALWILDARDWRCYALVLVSFPGRTSVTTGTLSGVCALLAAGVYRYRDDRLRAGVALTVGLATKLFLWPLGVWLLATRRARTAISATAAMLLLLAVSWLVVGVSNYGSYRDSVREARQLADVSYSPFALVRSFGVSPTVATLLVGAVGLAILSTSWFVKDEAITFTLAILAALVMSPVLWIHYLVLLFVPIAIVRPKLSPLWFVPLLYGIIGLVPHPDGSHIRIGLVLGLMGLIFALILRAAQSKPRLSLASRLQSPMRVPRSAPTGTAALARGNPPS